MAFITSVSWMWLQNKSWLIPVKHREGKHEKCIFTLCLLRRKIGVGSLWYEAGILTWISINSQGFDTDEWTAGCWIPEDSLNLHFWLTVGGESHFALPVISQKNLPQGIPPLNPCWQLRPLDRNWEPGLERKPCQEILKIVSWKVLLVSLEHFSTLLYRGLKLCGNQDVLKALFSQILNPPKLAGWALSCGSWSSRW